MSRFPQSPIIQSPARPLIAIRIWLALGCVALLLPEARAYSSQFGYLAYWLVIAPLILLLVTKLERRFGASRRASVAAGAAAWVTNSHRARSAIRNRRCAPLRIAAQARTLRSRAS